MDAATPRGVPREAFSKSDVGWLALSGLSGQDCRMTSVGKKIVSGVTGLASCGFIVAHLAGNLLLLVGADPFNEYTHFLGTFAHGFFLPVAEVGLIVLFLTHAAAGHLQISTSNRPEESALPRYIPSVLNSSARRPPASTAMIPPSPGSSTS